MVILNYILIVSGFFSTSFILFDNSNMESGLDAILLGFWLWANVPYLILLFANRFSTKTKGPRILVSLTVLVSVLAPMYLYYTAFYSNPDAQSGLVFIFLPIYQVASLI